MVAILKREEVSLTMEKRIAVGFITSHKFIQDITPSMDLSFFENRLIKQVVKWCVDYHSKTGKAPRNEIQNIYLAKRPHLHEEDAELIERLLDGLSKTFEDNINEDYLTDQTFDYFKQREIEITNNNVKYHLERHDLAAAEDEIVNYRKIAKTLPTWVNPFDQEMVESAFEEDFDTFFKFPGRLGDFLGRFKRGWLVGLSGPFKIGKSFFAEEFKAHALPQGRRVAEFNLEMSVNQVNSRFYRRLFPSGDIPSDKGTFLFPCFDCLKNQVGTCTLPQRTNSIPLLNDEGYKPLYDPNSEYRICTECRGIPDSDYETETWWEEIEKPAFDVGTISKRMKAARAMFGDLVRLKCYPRFSASVSDISRDLDLMEAVEGFIPDIIIIDYADILKPENDRISGVEKEDETWKMLARLASERRALLVVPTQLTKEALEAVLIKQKHTARWVGKLGHVDVMLSVNQTTSEKRQGRLRIGTLLHRHDPFDEQKTVTLLEKRGLGQVHLDSEYWIKKRREEET